jgi:hypothetical protein
VRAPGSLVIRLRRGVVTSVGAARPGAVELEVDVEGGRAPALAYPDLTGPVAVGDSVVLNTTAMAMGLGTGGVHFVVAVEGREHGHTPDGQVMKARYTPLQTAVTTVEETHAGVLERSAGLNGTPVVVCPLHSMIAPVAAGAKRAGGDATRVVYVMTDGAALPGGFSRLVPVLREAALVEGWITCGQAFGGELEAVTVWTALIGAVEAFAAEVIVVADGPGNLGTETTWGVSALAGGNTLNAASRLGGKPIPALRVSFADPRERHRGLSHHSLTILRDVCLVETNVPIPALVDGTDRAVVWDALRKAKLEERHQLVEVDGRPAVEEMVARSVAVTTMGRDVQEDPVFFEAAGAAGVLAGRIAAQNRHWRP